jgi:hypothetical protein
MTVLWILVRNADLVLTAILGRYSGNPWAVPPKNIGKNFENSLLKLS